MSPFCCKNVLKPHDRTGDITACFTIETRGFIEFCGPVRRGVTCPNPRGNSYATDDLAWESLDDHLDRRPLVFIGGGHPNGRVESRISAYDLTKDLPVSRSLNCRRFG